ncbi:hypothetical protein PUN28_004817 [Cardiocondyla obscurior]|uniref:Uncharacterized protein n=1 Tax=Cardiocondyla obscurior TaxID=286306 RepID=A0AAW2GHF5_9HYME
MKLYIDRRRHCAIAMRRHRSSRGRRVEKGRRQRRSREIARTKFAASDEIPFRAVIRVTRTKRAHGRSVACATPRVPRTREVGHIIPRTTKHIHTQAGA